jgi:hypothetical protein
MLQEYDVIVVGAGHDYIFWNQAGLKALDYFDELLMD